MDIIIHWKNERKNVMKNDYFEGSIKAPKLFGEDYKPGTKNSVKKKTKKKRDGGFILTEPEIYDDYEPLYDKEEWKNTRKM